MKSSNNFFFIAMAGMALLVEPAIGHTAVHKAKTHVRKSKPVPVTMESFTSGALDKQATVKLASSLFAAKDYTSGEVVVARLLNDYPDDDAVLRKIIDLYIAAQNAEKALPIYDRLIKINPKETKLIMKAAKAYSWTGRWEATLKMIESVLVTGDTSDATQREYIDVLYTNKQYGKATEYYLKYFTKNRQNDYKKRDYAIAFIYKLASSKEYTEAEKLLAAVETQYSRDIVVLETKANVALGKQDFSEALKFSDELIKRSPKNHPNETALLIKAEIASWQRSYANALVNYDSLISRANGQKSEYFRQKAYREKGRVLGWMARYGDAETVYDEAVRSYPNNKGLQAESLAKRAYYRNTWRPAVEGYKNWLLVEPNDPEALFDLGQLYMQSAKWSEAAETYQMMLKLMPEHRQAALAKEKGDILSSKRLFRSGIEYFNGKSEWKSTNVSYTGLYSSLSYPLEEQLTGFIHYDNKSFSFENFPGKFHQNNITTGIEYRHLPDFVIRGAYSYHANSQNIENNHTGFLETQSQPFNNVHLDVAFRNEEVIDNAETLRSRLQRDRWQGRLLYDGYRNWNAGLDYEVASYSDGNRCFTAGGDVTAHLLVGKERLNLVYRLQNYGFHDVSLHSYWTPSSFTTHSVGIDFRHYFNGELFQGVNETYYTTSYKVIAEPNDNVSHQVRATLCHDWSNRFSSSLETQYSWATAAFYEDKMVKAEIRWFF